MNQKLDYDGTRSSSDSRTRTRYSREERSEEVPYYLALSQVEDSVKASDVSILNKKKYKKTRPTRN